MHIALVGPGALGCLFASMLIKGSKGNGDYTISFVDHNIHRAKHIDTNGIVYEGMQGEKNYPVKAFSNPQKIGRVDAVFLCVKSYDVQQSLKFCEPLLKDDPLMIFLQNGIAHLEKGIYTGSAPPLFCTTTEGATCLGNGHVRHAGIGSTYFGFINPQPEQYTLILQNIISILEEAGMIVCYSRDIYRKLWAKLFINIGINALTAIHNCKNGELLNITDAREKMEMAIAEAEEVAKAEGVTIANPLEKTINVCQATAENISSMLQDVRHKKKTEIDAINGALVKLAQKNNIDTPINSLLVKLVKKMENQYSTT